MILEINILPSVAQELVMVFGTVKHRLTLQYNERSQIWTISIMEEVTKLVLIQGLPLVLGAELLEAYNFAIGKLMVVDNRGKNLEANHDDFTSNNVLVWFSEDEVLA